MEINGLIIRYGEIALKKKNRRKFEDSLKRNINKFIDREGYSYILKRLHGRFHIVGENFDKTFKNHLSLVPGITSFSEVYYSEIVDDEKILKDSFKYFLKSKPLGKFNFRIRVKRADKRFKFTSMEFEKKVAEYIYENYEASSNLSVKLKNSDYVLEIDIRSEGVFIFHERESGTGGLPIGSSGRFLSLLSGGIDSPVATYSIMKRGGVVDCLSFYSPPYIGEKSRQKFIDLVEKLSLIQGKMRLYIVPFTEIQEMIRDKVSDEYRTIFYRRFMFEVGNIIAEKNYYDGFVTGEALGQVASQTIQNIACIEEAANFPILRPLIAFDKDNIVNIAKKLRTFDISIIPAPDTCTLFAPLKPKIKGKMEDILKNSENLDYQLVKRAAENVELVEIG